jgi:hypothetical protein
VAVTSLSISRIDRNLHRLIGGMGGYGPAKKCGG